VKGAPSRRVDLHSYGEIGMAHDPHNHSRVDVKVDQQSATRATSGVDRKLAHPGGFTSGREPGVQCVDGWACQTDR